MKVAVFASSSLVAAALSKSRSTGIILLPASPTNSRDTYIYKEICDHRKLNSLLFLTFLMSLITRSLRK